MNKSNFLVVGSAHLDILARAMSRDDVVDKIGSFSIEIGGTAFNIAMNLLKMGSDVSFMSAMNDSAYSNMIEKYMKNQGVTTLIEHVEGMPNAGFSAHINKQGEMVSAISSMPIETHRFPSDAIKAAVTGKDAIVLDCNLSSIAMSDFVLHANEAGIPVYIAGVSEEKSLRISGISGRIDAIFINEREYEFFCKEEFGTILPLPEFTRIMNTGLVKTNGEKGADVIDNEGHQCHIPPVDIRSHLDSQMMSGTTLGMGDAMTAGIVFYQITKDLCLGSAANQCLDIVKAIGEMSNCHLGDSNAIESGIKEALHHAGHDAMTGIKNRLSMEQTLQLNIEKKHPFSIILLDIDHFKSINDTYGHNIGDDVIINVVNKAKSCLRREDIIGRWGGEEFIVILQDATLETAYHVATRIRKSVLELIVPRQITVSSGVTRIRNNDDEKTLVERADIALYQSKQNGRNQVTTYIEDDK